jgi:hypothetical protein
MSAKGWKTGVGVNHVGAYQVSGRPFASGNIDATVTNGHEISFPNLSRWFQVINRGTADCRVGFSQNGVVAGSNYFIVAKADADANGSTGTSGVLELKVASIYLSGSNAIDVVAGLTNIDGVRVSGSTGPNWSGSVGVG